MKNNVLDDNVYQQDTFNRLKKFCSLLYMCYWQRMRLF